MPDFDPAYSQACLNLNRSAIELNDQTVGAIITERQHQLHAVSLESSGLETVMDGIIDLHQQLFVKEGQITQSLNLHKRLGSALWRLPTEVLSQIFHYCLPEFGHSRPLSDREAPMSLTGVCQRWREVSVGTPSLWCGLRISPNRRHKWNNQVFRYDLWFKRSRGRPVSLAFSCCYIWHSSELRSFFQPYINQISSLSIDFSLGAKQLELLLTGIPALQELTISATKINGSAIVQCISRLPITLRSLKIHKPSFDHGHMSMYNRVWAHLTNVAITIHEPNSVLRLLQLTPNLVSLSISTPLLSAQDFEPFTHFRLQTLSIYGGSAPQNRLYTLFDFLSLPNLRTFEAVYNRPWPHAEFKAFLIRSNCPLETMILSYDVRMTDEQRAEYVALIPSIKAFSPPVKNREWTIYEDSEDEI
ncbi:hypothetical protein DEU56DRAFT_202605 [Suillus clintonianus]|uniref:uncharacterized protein n=1 Tax=Suillus clintonianus TaxID=1904413 RepID=UPI001B88417D|nr:uncharacterized protein DEU56DRAFT_202605 [Suillus clintonianus]KAG2112407.1 hypothetical protein DEU56DRAFT_202605 [Suillus clintonianus]